MNDIGMLTPRRRPDVLEMVPPRALTDDEYLDQAEGEIRGSGRNVVQNVVAIGKKLVEVKGRIAHGKYEAFVRDRLGFAKTTAHQFVKSYEWVSKVRTSEHLESLQIDASALYLLARRSTTEEVRTEALEKAEREGISHEEVEKLIAADKAEAERKTKASVAAETAKQIAEADAEAAEKIAGAEQALAKSEQKLADLETERATLEQSVRRRSSPRLPMKTATKLSSPQRRCRSASPRRSRKRRHPSKRNVPRNRNGPKSCRQRSIGCAGIQNPPPEPSFEHLNKFELTSSNTDSEASGSTG